MPKKRPQGDLHMILKPIRYHGPGPHYRKRIEPDDGLLLPFGHLDDAGYALLIKKRVLAPATPADIKALDDAEKAREAAIATADKAAAEALAKEKSVAMAKQLKQRGE